MTVTNFLIENFRNLRLAEISPVESVNILYGQNAQGKTNLLEALWLCTGAKSFREANANELVNFESEKARLSLDFFSRERNQNIELILGEEKKITQNGVVKKSSTELVGNFNAVVFSPDHLSLIKDGPEERRKFMDTSLSSLRPGARTLVNRYKKILIQRNNILKELPKNRQLNGYLETLNEMMSLYGAKLCYQRQKYIEAVMPFVIEFYDGLSRGNEKLTVSYEGEYLANEDGKDILLREIEAATEKDKKLFTSTAGPHRHDLIFEINGKSARNFGSQGQQRSAALALKLAEAKVLENFFLEKPIILLDDVMSELDEFRQDFVINQLTDLQVFITCCDPHQVAKMTEGKSFYIENGIVTEKSVKS